MKQFVTHAKTHWFNTIVAFTLLALAGVLFTTASAKNRFTPVSSPATTAQRTAIYAPAAPDAFTFGNPIQLTRPLSPAFFQQGGEPEIKADVFGNIYVTAIQGVPGGVDLWKSVDNGATFTYLGQPDGAQDKCTSLPQCNGLGGADDSIDVSSGGYLYVSSLWLGGTTLSTSFDGGMGGVVPGQAWQVNPKANGDPPIPVNDRQWLAAYGPETVYMTFDNAPVNAGIWFTKSTDAGKTFTPPVNITGGVGTIRRTNNMVVDQYNGNIYATYTPTGGPNQIRLLKSTDGGTTWSDAIIYTGPAGTTVENAFPILAVDRGGNVHLVFTESTGTGSASDVRTNAHVFLMSSPNQGTSWLPKVQVDSGANTQSTVMPYIIAGSPGVVNVTWLGSSSTSPDAAPFDWRVFFAQTTNALSATPTFTQVTVTPNPIHDLRICSAGGNCPAPTTATSTRALLEYYTMTLDPEGNALIAYADGLNNCPTSNCLSNAWFVKQTGGTKAYNPPAAPGPATFGANIPVGSPGSEPSIWVDSFNCIFVTAPGNPWVWKSTNNGLSFLAPVNPVADEPTLTGGDEDIIAVPKQDGSHTRPDQLYFTDLGLSSCHIRKSTDGGATWAKPGPGGAAGDVSVSSDRQWLAWDQGYPAAGDQIIYHWEHELASEAMRFSSLVNDTAWQASPGITDPELFDPQTTTLPNTNPGPIFVNHNTHRVFALFNGSVPVNNTLSPPFGKLLNVWEADAAPPLNTAAPVTDVQNHPVFKGTYDSPNNPPPAVGPPVGPNYGTNNANIFPAGDIDSAGNIYVAWSMNNSRTNEFSIWFASSHDHGKTFYGPFPVSSGPLAADETAVFPWVAAGDNGRVDIIWYKTTAVGDPNTLTGNPPWHLYFAQSLNANSREPVFTVVQPNPGNIIHNGQISTGGTLGSSDRSLLDFMEVAIGPDGLANIIFADNAGQGTRAEYTRQTGGPLAKANPTFPTCLAAPPSIISLVSRKTHGTGTFDIDMPLTAPRGVECRGTGSTNDYTLVFTFPNSLTSVGSASVTGHDPANGTGSVCGSSMGPDPNQYTVQLCGVSTGQYITVTLNSVLDSSGNTGNVVSPQMGILVGDVTANGSVSNTDVSNVKAQVSAPVTNSNFRHDVTANGAVSNTDVSTTKGQVGVTLPSSP